MRHIRKFNESNLMLDTNIIGDILEDITDLNYLSQVESSWWSDKSGNTINIYIFGKEEYNKSSRGNDRYIYIDEILEVIERLVDFLKNEGYRQEEITKKSIETLKSIPTEKTKSEIIFGRSNKTNGMSFRWDEVTNSYKLCHSLNLYFRQE